MAWKWPVALAVSLLVVFACHQSSLLDAVFSPVPDFEPQESTYVCWTPKFQQVIIPLVREISEHEQVTLFYNEKYHRKATIREQLVRNQANLRNIDLQAFKLEKDNIWIRDYGPSFLQSQNGDIRVMGFEYPHLEYKDYRNFSDQVSRKMKIPFHRSKIYSTGGGREINGKGTILLVEQYEKFVNPGLTKDQIEAEYRQNFGQTNFIWLKRGIPQDDFMNNGPVMEDIYGYGVQGHIDEFCRFVDANTILLTAIDSADMSRDPFYRVIHERLEENYQILLKARDQDGKPFKIIRAPQAPVIFANGKLDTTDIYYTPVTSYMNYVVTNHSVILPGYAVDDAPDWVREKDEKARQVFQQVFKNRQVKMIDALELNYEGGGLHCITLSKPKPKKGRFSLLRTRKGSLG